MKPAAPTLSFDATENIMHVGFASMAVDTAPEVDAAFRTIERFWTRDCGAQKVYAVIDYTGFKLNIAVTDVWAAAVKHAVETYSIATLRVAKDLSARAALRAVAVKIHHPSNVYATREDAIAVVRGLRSQKIKLRAG